MKKWIRFGALVTLAACGDEASTRDDEVRQHLQTFEEEADQTAREVCGAPANVEELEAGDSEAASCYFELSAGTFTQCAEDVFAAHPDETEALLECWRRDSKDMLECCKHDGRCTYSGIEDCREILWNGASEGRCDVDTAAIGQELDACT